MIGPPTTSNAAIPTSAVTLLGFRGWRRPVAESVARPTRQSPCKPLFERRDERSRTPTLSSRPSRKARFENQHLTDSSQVTPADPGGNESATLRTEGPRARRPPTRTATDSHHTRNPRPAHGPDRVDFIWWIGRSSNCRIGGSHPVRTACTIGQMNTEWEEQGLPNHGSDVSAHRPVVSPGLPELRTE